MWDVLIALIEMLLKHLIKKTKETRKSNHILGILQFCIF